MRRALGALLTGAALLAAPLAAQDPAPRPGDRLQVYLVTMGPGSAVWERFGHNALWIRDTVARRDLVYNYGMFDFDDPGFLQRFMLGKPRYWLAAFDLEQTMRQYEHRRRDVMVQELALPSAARAELAMLLAENERPERRTYTYDYYRDNCSTRVRDMLDRVLGGTLRRATEGKGGEGSLRFHTLRSVTNDPLMLFGMDLALGPAADRSLDQWGEMFLPERLQARVRELRVTGDDGLDAPLVRRETTLLEFGEFRVEAAPPKREPMMAVGGLLLALLVGLATRGGALGTIGRVIGGTWLLVAGIGGLVLLGLWAGTQHWATAANRNLLLLSPVALLLVPRFWGRRTRGPGAFAVGAAWVLLGSVLLGVLAAALPGVSGQTSIAVALLAGPPTLVAAVIARRVTLPPAGAPSSLP